MNEKQIEINPVVAALVIAQLLFTIFMIVCFQNVLADDIVELGVEIDSGVSVLGDIPQEEKNVLEHYIYQAVSKNTTSNNIQKNSIVVRDGSVVKKYDENFDLYFINFVVDLPETQQAYMVFDEWSGSGSYEYISPNDPVNVVCYEEAECDDDGAIQKFINGTFKRHGYRMPSDSTISVLPDDAYDSESDDNAIKINFLSCDTQCECKKVESAEKTLAVNLLSDYIESYGFQLNDINYYFDNCGGD